jgi:glycerophosphoryl diester phosphodiesterase
MAAFRLAFEHGADGIELDAKLSADQHVMVIHDATLKRTTEREGRVGATELPVLRSLDAGQHFGPAFKGEKIPTLDEVLEAFGRKGIINIELTNYTTPTDQLADKVCACVLRHGVRPHVLFSSFLVSNLRRCGKLLPDVPRALLALPGWPGAWARSFGFMFADFQCLHSNLTDASAQHVQRVHRLRRRVHVWTVNRTEDVQRLYGLGVDGIITDDPRRAAIALGRPL